MLRNSILSLEVNPTLILGTTFILVLGLLAGLSASPAETARGALDEHLAYRAIEVVPPHAQTPLLTLPHVLLPPPEGEPHHHPTRHRQPSRLRLGLHVLSPLCRELKNRL